MQLFVSFIIFSIDATCSYGRLCHLCNDAQERTKACNARMEKVLVARSPKLALFACDLFYSQGAQVSPQASHCRSDGGPQEAPSAARQWLPPAVPNRFAHPTICGLVGDDGSCFLLVDGSGDDVAQFLVGGHGDNWALFLLVDEHEEEGPLCLLVDGCGDDDTLFWLEDEALFLLTDAFGDVHFIGDLEDSEIFQMLLITFDQFLNANTSQKGKM